MNADIIKLAVCAGINPHTKEFDQFINLLATEIIDKFEVSGYQSQYWSNEVVEILTDVFYNDET